MPKIQQQENRVSIPPTRTYSELELQKFHNLIQRFYGEPKTLENGEIAQKFYWDELAVHYGAMSRWLKRDRFLDNTRGLEMVKKGEKFIYMTVAGEDGTCKRMTSFMNLWKQYERYMQGKEWKKEAAVAHQTRAYEQMAEETALQDVLF